MKLISRDKKYCWGQPRIVGTRITVSNIKAMYNGGESISALAEIYSVTEDQILACINYCKRGKKVRNYILINPK
jgi:uncharacterized protein (DUF433 family)